MLSRTRLPNSLRFTFASVDPEQSHRIPNPDAQTPDKAGNLDGSSLFCYLEFRLSIGHDHKHDQYDHSYYYP
jgi:hypothetical protein